MKNNIWRKLAVLGVVGALTATTGATLTSKPDVVNAATKETWITLDGGKTTINSRNSQYYYPYSTDLVVRPAELPNHALVMTTLRVKNVSKSFNQTVYAANSVLYAYRDGKAIYTMKPYKSFSDGLKTYTLKPGKQTPYFSVSYTYPASKFKTTAAEYYCVITPVKEGKYGKSREVGLCADNPKFKK